MKNLAFLPLFAILAACSGQPKIVRLPVSQPCVTGAIPAEPETLNGKLTGDSGRDIGLIAGTEKEVRAWGRALHGMLEACTSAASPRPASPSAATPAR